MKKSSFILLASAASISGCHYPTPRQNFDLTIQSYEGRQLGNPIEYSLLAKSEFLGEHTTAEGLPVKEYVWKGPHGDCRFDFVLSSTGTVIDAYIVGDPAPCAIAP